MIEHDFLAEQFETHRGQLRAMAVRMLGSPAEADDAVQEAWLRLARSDATEIENLGGWLTTVVARVALDRLRARTARREDLGEDESDGVGPRVLRSVGNDPEQEAVLADSLGAALLLVLDTLRPAERMAFVLHDLFAVPFDEIAVILGRSPNATKQLASRARNKVQGTEPEPGADVARHQAVVDAFLAASRRGDFEALVALLDPDIELRADDGAVQMGSPGQLRGAAAVAGMFSGRASGAQTALLDGAAGMVWMVGGRSKVAWDFTVVDGKVRHIDMLASAETLAEIEFALSPS